ncbi:acyltransferase [Pseudonocardia bannensis]|uniref:Acyltransferase n=1 Tax=Pseudonocardia bannensis TaxID=630973 RepID=A0A848DD38_9PSEU|nr:acyltransferase [Pseudonocardia bannensis]NMH90529.1 acyltransferase [Pseudonocardia bannensis]
MRLLDGVITRLLGGTVDALVAEKLAERIEQLKLDALYRPRWHGDRARLHLADTAVVNNALFNLSGGTVTVGEYAFFGHDVAVLTGTHDIERFGRERQLAITRSGRDVVIGDGVWLASHVLVLGPVTIGEHAVVAAGSLVRDDVEPYTVVAGRPARPVKQITRTAR